MFWLQACEVVVPGLVTVAELAFEVHKRQCVVIGVVATRAYSVESSRRRCSHAFHMAPTRETASGGSTTCHAPLRASATYVADAGVEQLFVQEFGFAEDGQGNSRRGPIRAYFGLGGNIHGI
jgi:hypothetical protein